MEKKRILCFGDSNTWGFIAGTELRRGEKERWTGVLQDILGDEYRVIEDGLNGRTTVYDDPLSPYKNGLKALGYTLMSQKPLDLVIVMLGTNDYKFTDTQGAAYGIDEIVRNIVDANVIYRCGDPIFHNGAKVLLIAPIPLPPTSLSATDIFARNAVESYKLAGLCEDIARRKGIYFLDAGKYAKASPVDNVHLDAQSHIALGKAVAEEVKKIL